MARKKPSQRQGNRRNGGTDDPLADRLMVSVRERQSEPAKQALHELLTTRGEKWRRVLLMHPGFPDPGGSSTAHCDQYGQHATFLRGVAREVAQGDASLRVKMEELTRVLLAGMLMNEFMRQNVAALPTLGHWQLPRQTRVWRVAAFLESQHYIVQRDLIAASRLEGTFYTEKMANAETEAETGVKANLQAAIDARVESADLILRYDAHRSKGEAWGPLDPEARVYEDEDFKRLQFLSESWRIHQDVWATVKFQGDEAVCADKDVVLISPARIEEFRRAAVGAYRARHIEAGYVSIDLGAGRGSDTPERLGTLAKSIRLPSVGECWDGSIDTGLLRKACEATWNSRHIWLEMERLHYATIAADLRVGPDGQDISFLDWERITDILRTLARCFTRAIEEHVADVDGHGCLKAVVRVGERDLVRIVYGACADLPQGTVERGIRLLTYSPSRQKLELWDQPLLPFAGDTLLLLPNLLCSGSPIRALENFIDEWRTSDFDRRGKVFERFVVDMLADTGRMEASAGVCLRGGELETDVVVVWDRKVLLIECKCLKSVFSPADEFRAREAIAHGIEQLRIRREALVADWDRLVAAIPILSGADRPNGVEDVSCVVVTNLLIFTSHCEDGIVVADEHVLRRYFGDKGFTIHFNSGPGGVSLCVKDAMPEHAVLNKGHREFLAYIREPPQVRRIQDGLRLVPEPIGSLTGVGIHVFRTLPEFSGVASLIPSADVSAEPPAQEGSSG